MPPSAARRSQSTLAAVEFGIVAVGRNDRPRQPESCVPLSLYNAEISAGSLLPSESRRLARLLLNRPTDAEWDAAIVVDNVLQKRPATARRQATLIRKRLTCLEDAGLRMVVDGDSELCGQVLLAAALQHSRLLSDFMRDVYAADVRRLERTLSRLQWQAFLTECAHRDEGVGAWAASTRVKLFEVIARILAEARFLGSTRRRELTPPLVHPRLREYLMTTGGADTLARMEYNK